MMSVDANQDKTVFPNQSLLPSPARKRFPAYIIICAALALGGLLLCLRGVYAAYYECRLQRGGITVQAQLRQHYLRNVMPRIEYCFRDSAGRQYCRDAALEKNAWHGLKGAPSVPVRYLPEKPEWNCPASGEAARRSHIGTIVVGLATAAGAALLMTILRLSAGRSVRRSAGQNVIAAVDAELRTPPVVVTVKPEIPAAAENGVIRPGGLGIIAILNIIYALLSFFTDLLRLIFIKDPPLRPESAALQSDISFSLILYGVGAILALLFLISGWGIFKMKEWGRKAALTGAVGLAIVSLIAILEKVYMLSELDDVPQEALSGEIAGIFFAMMLSLFWMVYPVIAIFILGRSSVKDQFSTEQTALRTYAFKE